MSNESSSLKSQLKSMLDQSTLDEIAAKTGVSESKTNRRAVGMVLGPVVSKLQEFAQTSQGKQVLTETIEYSPEGGIDGSRLAGHLFDMPETVARLAEHCEITPEQGQSTVEATSAWALTKASSLESDPQKLVSKLADPVGVWTTAKAAAPVGAAATKVADVSESAAERRASSSGNGLTGLLVGAALGAVLLIGGFAFFGGGSESATEAPAEVIVSQSDIDLLRAQAANDNELVFDDETVEEAPAAAPEASAPEVDESVAGQIADENMPNDLAFTEEDDSEEAPVEDAPAVDEPDEEEVEEEEEAADYNVDFDTTGGGAYLRVEGGVVYLEGDVQDQRTVDAMVSWLDDVTAPFENNLQVVDGAPLPSGRVLLADGLKFETGSAELAEVDTATALPLLQLSSAHPEWSITIVGHTDNIGGDAYNKDLSMRRAEALVESVLATTTIDPARIDARGAGSSEPIASNATEEGRALNRRIEFEFRPVD